MKIIVGLGNPGEKYKKSRHNAAWIFLNSLLGEETWRENKKFNALVLERNGLTFLKPLTYMNNSGYSVRKIMDYYGLIPKKFGLISKKGHDFNDTLTLIHDELDIEFPKYKISKNSGSAGHNGVASVINQIKSKSFSRLRLGIANPLLRDRIPAEKFVMQNFSQEEYLRLVEMGKNFDINSLL